MSERFVFCSLVDLKGAGFELEGLEICVPGVGVRLLVRDVPFVEDLAGTLLRTVRVGAITSYQAVWQALKRQSTFSSRYSAK